MAESDHEMNVQDIQNYLPHRYPFLLVDRVTEIMLGQSITAYKNITFNEEIFQGHFPESPIFPGVLIIESLAQASGVLGFRTMGKTPEDGFLYLLAGMDKVRFKKQVVPGDKMVLESKIITNKRNIWKFDAQATVEGELCASAELICAIVTK